MVASLCGHIVVWSHRCLVTSLCGRIVVWSHRCVVTSLCGRIVVWSHRCALCISRTTLFCNIIIQSKFVEYVLPHISTHYGKYGNNRVEYNIYILRYLSSLLHLYMIPTLIDSLDLLRLMWSFQFNDSSIRTPRNFVTRTLEHLQYCTLI